MLEFLWLWNSAPLLASILLLLSRSGDTAVSSHMALPDKMLLPGGIWVCYCVSASLATYTAELNGVKLSASRVILSTRKWLLRLTKGMKSWLSPSVALTAPPHASTSLARPECSRASGQSWSVCFDIPPSVVLLPAWTRLLTPSYVRICRPPPWSSELCSSPWHLRPTCSHTGLSKSLITLPGFLLWVLWGQRENVHRGPGSS